MYRLRTRAPKTTLLDYDTTNPQPDYDTGFDPGFDFEPDAQYWANQDTQQTQDDNGVETADAAAADQSTNLTWI